MEPQHWLQRWENNQIGFHQQQINAHLETFWPGSGVEAGCPVFVPLCGKSLDMLWLRAQGHPVLGVEISRKAVHDFFSENDLPISVSEGEFFERWECDGVTLLVGNFFDLTPQDIAGFGAVYDRASLVALPPAMRNDYARHMVSIKPHDAVTLLISMEYPQQEMNGPPFSVEEPEVRALYEPNYRVERLLDEDVLAENSPFRQRGLSRLHEKVYRLTTAR
jgi:thiopurine S-methyltransferase